MLKNAATQTRKRPRGQRARWFGHPLILLAIIAALGLDFWSIPSGPFYTNSTIKHAAYQAWKSTGLAGATGTGPRNWFPGIFLTRGDDVEFVWYDLYANVPSPLVSHDLQRLIQEGWLPLGGASTWVDRENGIFHMTERWASFRIHGDPPPDTQTRMMARFVGRYDELPADHEIRKWAGYANIRRLYAQGKDTETSIIWTGYLRNTLALTLLLALITLPIRGRTDLHLRAWHGRLLKRRQPWQCTNCGYDTTGLRQCPECGTPVKGDTEP